MERDLELRAALYRHFADRARAPSIDEMAHAVSLPAADVAAAYRRLAGKRMLVLMPDGVSIRMAPPFSGIETQHRVNARGRVYFANCAWDSFGIAAALHEEAVVRSRCEQTHEPLRLTLPPDGRLPSTWIFHAAVPAAHWWRDIVYT